MNIFWFINEGFKSARMALLTHGYLMIGYSVEYDWLNIGQNLPFEEDWLYGYIDLFFWQISHGWRWKIKGAVEQHGWLMQDWSGSSQGDAIPKMQAEFFWRQLNGK